MSIPVAYAIRLPGSRDAADAVRDHAQHRLSFALRHFPQTVRRLTVRVVDLNGPRKGVDSRCTIHAELANGASIIVEATTAWPTGSVRRACHMLKEAIRRNVTKARRPLNRRAPRYAAAPAGPCL